jgi:hypothetical protein
MWNNYLEEKHRGGGRGGAMHNKVAIASAYNSRQGQSADCDADLS